MSSSPPERNVLLVDDSDLTIAILCEEFAEEGWDVSVATSGAQALEVFTGRAAHVVVCDLHMPDMDGFEVMDRLHALDPQLPVVIHSGDEDLSAVLKAVRRGAFDYVPKSADTFEPLLAAMERACAHSLLVRDNRSLQEALRVRLDQLEVEVREREEAQRALARARDDALAASRTKSTFLANMSHELRTPLNAIIGYAELLMEDAQADDDEDAAHDLEKILRAGKHLLALINDVLDLAKIEAGRVVLQLGPVDVRRTLQELVDSLRPAATASGSELRLDVADEVGTMLTDDRKLRQCVLNLGGNACKFTLGGRVDIVARREEAAGSWLVVEVRDTGIGMSEAHLARIFDEFTQADESTTRRFGGTGLGLAITQRLAGMMGGSVHAASEVGVGSVFTLRIPDARLPGGQVPKPHRPRTPRAGRRILVIDDDETMCELVGRYLETSGYQVLSETDGQAGLEAARRERPDLICVDLMLTAADGRSVLGRIKEDPDLADVPVIGTTISEETGTGRVLGAADFVPKPIRREELLKVIRRHLPSPGGTVLVVDDEPAVRETTSRLLVAAGWQVRQAENGRAALEAIAHEAPSIILLDLMMPELDGFGVLDALRSSPDLGRIPVVVFTAMDLSDELHARLKRQVQGVVQKAGFSREALLHELSRVVYACLEAE